MCWVIFSQLGAVRFQFSPPPPLLSVCQYDWATKVNKHSSRWFLHTRIAGRALRRGVTQLTSILLSLSLSLSLSLCPPGQKKITIEHRDK